MCVSKNSLGQSHEIIRRVVKAGDFVIDATAGNGNDTLMLAELVGQTGKVYAFDIQKTSVERTTQKLFTAGMLERVKIINDSHHRMDEYADGEIKAVMFNLGYLPGGDHCIGTRGETTVEALEKAMRILQSGGVITMVVYYGGDSGFEEKEIIMEYLKGIDSKLFTVMKTEFANQKNCPPILVCIQKLPC